MFFRPYLGDRLEYSLLLGYVKMRPKSENELLVWVKR